jgi:hypothetical protein
MALGTLTLARLTEIVRSLVQTYTNTSVSPIDIQDALNLKQDTVFTLMPRDMKKFWYGKLATVATVAIDTTSGYLAGARPTDMWDVVSMKRVWTESAVGYRQDLKKIDLEEFEEYLKNRFRDVPGYCVFGDKVLFSFVATQSASIFVIAYIRTPVTMTVVGSFLDLPNQFADVLVAMAGTHCVAQLNVATEAKATALQVFAMMEQEARAAAGLPLQSDAEDKTLSAQAGHQGGSLSGGSKGTTRPTVT